MKKTALILAFVLTLSSFGLAIVSHAGDLPPIALTTSHSAVTRIAGDANGDGSVDLKDAAAIVRHLAGGWNVTINESAADVNGDNKVNLKDVTIIRRYLADDWTVALL